MVRKTLMTEYLESELIELLIKKDRAGFHQAIKQYQPTMRALASRIVGDGIADEVVQEAWISVMRSLPKFERRSTLKTWLLAIVANEAKTRLRKEKSTISLDSVEGENSPSLYDDNGNWRTPPARWELNTPYAILTANELYMCIETTMNVLPPLQAGTLQLREIDNLSFNEICNILEISESNVRVLLHRARQTLYQVIEHFQSTGECKPCSG